VPAPHPDDFDAIGCTLRYLHRQGHVIHVAVLTAGALTALVAGVAVGTWSAVCRECPSVAQIYVYEPQRSTRILDVEGRLVAELFMERRTPVELATLPSYVPQAFVAVEPEIPLLDGLYGGRFHAPNPFSFGLAPLVSPVRGDITVFGLSHPRVDVAGAVLGEFGMDQVEVLSSRLPTGEYLDEIAPVGHVLSCHVRQGRPGLVRRRPAHELVGATGKPPR
jgi:hypothetical protein